METPTDMEIVRRVQAGDAEAFGELVGAIADYKIEVIGCHAGDFHPSV